MPKHVKSNDGSHPLSKLITLATTSVNKLSEDFDWFTVFKNKSEQDYRKCIIKKSKDDYDNMLNFATSKKHRKSFNTSFEYGCKKARLEAFAKYAYQYAKPYNTKYDYAEDAFRKLAIRTPIVKQNEYGYQHKLLAIAIYILDLLRISSAMDEALIYLSYYTENQPECISNTVEFTDSYHDKEVILAMMNLIRLRNSVDNNSKGGLVSTETIEYMLSSKNKIEYRDTKFFTDTDDMSDEEYQQFLNKTACEIKHKADSMSNRERMNAILSLIPEEAVNACISRFKDLVEKFYEAILIDLSPYYETFKNHNKKCINIYTEMIDYTRRIIRCENEQSKELNRIVAKHKQQKSSCLAVFNNNFNTEIDDNDEFNAINSIESYFDHVNEMNNYNNLINKYLDKLSDTQIAILDFMSDQNNLDRTFNENNLYTAGLDIRNPYEVCFGYFMLFELQTDFAWLIDINDIIIDKALNKLPWVNNVSDYFAKLVDCTEVPISCNVDTYWNNKESDNIYDFDYNDAGLYIMSDINKIPKKELHKENLSQLIYTISSQIMPRKIMLSDTIITGLKKSGISNKNIYLTSQYINTALTSNNKTSFDSLHEFFEDDSSSNTEDLTEIQNTISQLKKQLHESNKKIAQIQEDYDKIKDEHEFEKNELISLRETIYDIQNNQNIESIESKVDISLPYTVNRKILICGGHESWLAEIKSLLKNIRCVNPYDKPNDSLVRNCDEIWMQTNAMSHSFYTKIMNITRAQKIPVYYFKYASAEKDAIQLAMHDLNSTEN